MRRVTEGFDCSTFRFGPSGQILDARQQDMDGGTNYRFFCLHVRNLIAAICGIELAFLIWMFVSHNKYPLTVCQTPNTTTNNEIPNIRSPAQIHVQEQRFCSTYSIIIIFTVLHAFVDLTALVGILIKKHHFVLPLIILLVSNIVVSIIFIFNAIITYLFFGSNSGGYFLFFIVLQTIIRFYEFSCSRKLYWFFRWTSDEHYMPQSLLLKPEDSSNSFQF